MSEISGQLLEIDFGVKFKRTPEDVKQQYRSIIPKIIETNPKFSPQEALDYVKATEETKGASLFGTYLNDDATPTYKAVFNRKLLGLKSELKIISEDEKQKLEEINIEFKDASQKLAKLRNISENEADNLLVDVSSCDGLTSFSEAINRLTKGPEVAGFNNNDSSQFKFTNEELLSVLKTSFGLDALLNGRVMKITKMNGFPVRCKDTGYGNECLKKYNARWSGSFLLLPDKASYEQVEMFLEGKANPEEIEHSFKLRAGTDDAGGYTAIKIYEFAVEKSSHFDYLQELPLSEQGKMEAYFLGIVAHEVTHGLQAYALDRTIFNEYQKIMNEERVNELGHEFVSNYVDRHKKLYKSGKNEVLKEDSAEAVRIYLTNSEYLKKNYPKRYAFIQQNLPFVKENAITKTVLSNA